MATWLRKCISTALLVSALCIHEYAVVTGAAAVECKFEHEDYCKCKLPDGHELDLTPLKDIPAFLDPTAAYTWSPCGDVLDFPGTACSAGVAACQFEDSNRYSIGTTASVSVVMDDSRNPATFNLSYTGGTEKRQTLIQALCSPVSPGSLSFEGEDPKLTYNLMLASSTVCKVTVASSPISGGSIVLIVFFASLFLYLSIGVIYMHAAKEAVGMQKIPNYAFWSTLPGYIKAGLGLIFPCCGSTSKEGYSDIDGK
eukprot:scpid78582/ scgid7155/ 